ncbi:MAG: hypothetical protein NVSMB51_14180 [Solirubrobacteraceae bacterium]
MLAARRQLQGCPECHAEQAPRGVEHVEQAREVVLVGAAAVQQHEHAGGRSRRLPAAADKGSCEVCCHVGGSVAGASSGVPERD